MARSLTFNGTDLSAHGLTVLRSPRVWTPPTVARSRIVPFSDKAYSTPNYYGPRSISLDVFVEGTSPSNCRTKLDAIAAVLNSREDAALILDVWPGRYWMARLSGQSRFIQEGQIAKGAIEFRADDPHAFSTTETVDTETLPSALGFTQVAGGTADAYPVWMIEATGGATTVVLENETTSERVAWVGNVPAGEWLRFDADPANWLASTSNDGSDWTVAMSGVSGEFPRLVPGNNAIAITGVSNGELTITFRDRYV